MGACPSFVRQAVNQPDPAPLASAGATRLFGRGRCVPRRAFGLLRQPGVDRRVVLVVAMIGRGARAPIGSCSSSVSPQREVSRARPRVWRPTSVTQAESDVPASRFHLSEGIRRPVSVRNLDRVERRLWQSDDPEGKVAAVAGVHLTLAE